MNERTKNDLKLLNDNLICDTSYERNGKQLKIFIQATLGDVKMPVYKVAVDCKRDDFDVIYNATEMGMGRLNNALIQAVKSTEVSDLKDTINRGLAYIRKNGKENEHDKIIKQFKNRDFRADLNLIEIDFKGLVVEPDLDNIKLNLYIKKDEDDNELIKATSVDKDSQVVRVVNSLNKFGYKVSDVFLLALRNQIREFKELFSEELIAKKKEQREKELKENE